MSARIINFEEARASRAKTCMKQLTAAASVDPAPELMERFQFWTGASGRRYVHTIYSLMDCPALSSGNVILVKRATGGQRTVLDINLLGPNSPTLNLAEIRQRGATLGANEVHVHLLAENEREAQRIAFDLQCGHPDQSGAHASTTQH